MLWILLTVGATVFLILAAGVAYVRLNARSRLAISADVPGRVDVGSRVHLRVHVSNPTRSRQVFEILSIDNTFLKQFKLVGLSPQGKGMGEALGSRGFQYGTALGPDEAIEVRVVLEATTAGLAKGEVSAVNSRLVGRSTAIATQVVESAS